VLHQDVRGRTTSPRPYLKKRPTGAFLKRPATKKQIVRGKPCTLCAIWSRIIFVWLKFQSRLIIHLQYMSLYRLKFC